MNGELKEEHVCQVRMNHLRLALGLKSDDLSGLAREILGYVDDPGLLAILANLSLSPGLDTLNRLVEYLDQSNQHSPDEQYRKSQVHAEMARKICRKYLVRIPRLSRRVDSLRQTGIDGKDLDLQLADEFFVLCDEFYRDFWLLSKHAPDAWYTDDLRAVEVGLSFADHIVSGERDGVDHHNWPWDMEIVDWMETLRAILRRLSGRMHEDKRHTRSTTKRKRHRSGRVEEVTQIPTDQKSRIYSWLKDKDHMMTYFVFSLDDETSFKREEAIVRPRGFQALDEAMASLDDGDYVVESCLIDEVTDCPFGFFDVVIRHGLVVYNRDRYMRPNQLDFTPDDVADSVASQAFEKLSPDGALGLPPEGVAEILRLIVLRAVSLDRATEDQKEEE